MQKTETTRAPRRGGLLVAGYGPRRPLAQIRQVVRAERETTPRGSARACIECKASYAVQFGELTCGEVCATERRVRLRRLRLRHANLLADAGDPVTGEGIAAGGCPPTRDPLRTHGDAA